MAQQRRSSQRKSGSGGGSRKAASKSKASRRPSPSPRPSVALAGGEEGRADAQGERRPSGPTRRQEGRGQAQGGREVGQPRRRRPARGPTPPRPRPASAAELREAISRACRPDGPADAHPRAHRGGRRRRGQPRPCDRRRRAGPVTGLVERGRKQTNDVHGRPRAAAGPRPGPDRGQQRARRASAAPAPPSGRASRSRTPRSRRAARRSSRPTRCWPRPTRRAARPGSGPASRSPATTT